jgi:formylglycine-generating enzyme required for sulfatase activity
MINKAGEPVVMDFGLAKKSTKVGENVTPVDGTSGTPAYMAPEQFNGKSFDRAELSDQYSIGVIFYQLICGKLPFEAETLVNLISKINYENPTRPSFVNPEVDENIEKICLKAFNKNPDLRYLNLKELVADLNEYLKGDPSTQTARPSAELSQQTAGEIRVSKMLGGRSMEIASRILADARDQSLFQPIKKKKKKKKDLWVRSLLGYGSLSFLIVLVSIVFYKNRSYFSLGTNSNVISVEANKNNGGPGIDALKPKREVDISFFLVSPFNEAKAKETKTALAKSLNIPSDEKADLGNGTNLEMVLIPAGKFMMGSPASEKDRNENETQHEVTLTKPFYMGKYEVTQEQWEAVMGNNPSVRTKGAKLPVTDVSWNNCQEFIQKLNAKTNGGYRLPTEAEWEYACRAGTTTAYSVGESISKDDANWAAAQVPESIKVVGNYKANAFGLYDMHGNVLEWCEDKNGDYPVGPVTDPKGSRTGTNRVWRGGAFNLNAPRSRSSLRHAQLPTHRHINLGFRLAKTVNIKIGGSPEIPKPDPTLVKPTTEGLLVSPFTEAKAREVQKEAAKRLQKEMEEKADLGNGTNLDMVLIPAGRFMMGSPASEKGHRNDETEHEVTLTKPFYMGKYEVTQEQWQAIIQNNPSSAKGTRLPVTNVSWEDCQDFIRKLNSKTSGGYRLPSEAEWEYACRAGTTTAFCFGNKINRSDANYGPGGKSVLVGSYKANAFGLYDMHGNVWEWCEDWHGEYPAESVTDPKGAVSGVSRVGRGGSFYTPVDAAKARASFRGGTDLTPATRNDTNGFRLARTAL